MCELLGISSNIETNISFSFKILKEHSIRNYHGWGYAHFQRNKWIVENEPIMALRSEKAGEIIINPHMFEGKLFISHIRYSSEVNQTIENTHPFMIELFDKNWVFAHNGHLKKRKMLEDMQKGFLQTSLENYQPKGESDSELAFCIIMEETRKIGKRATDREIIDKLNEIAGRIAEYGSFNFILSDGEKMYAYRKGNTLYYVERKPPYSEAIRSESKEIELLMKPVEERTVVIATVPLTRNENWIPLEKDRLYSFEYGTKRSSNE